MRSYAVAALGPPCSERWSSPAYEAQLRGFVEAALGPVVLERVRVRPWSTIWRAVDRTGATFWAKENCPASRFEAGLLALLGGLVPDRVVPVVAADVERGLLLTPDQGPVLGFEHADLATWTRILGEWAALQRDLVPHAGAMVGCGLDVLAVPEYLDLLDSRVAALRTVPDDDPRRLSASAAERAVAARDLVARDVEVLGALGLPLCLTHNDLHGHNVFAAVAEAPLRFFDLGDAVLADPTTDLLTPLGCLSDVLGCDRDDPRLWRVAEGWVEVWSDVVPAPALRAALPAALRLARLVRHETWLRITTWMTGQEGRDWGGAGAEYLEALGAPPLLGR